ncbi:cytochrome P450 [Mycobacterium triplex]|uniref:cytochrome P450 n=1 Tax=Mycobacterium triplex TaxID=47839 RepID=UPI001E462CF4|nr:cytochrome P450 [Mycobacterium triplex]
MLVAHSGHGVHMEMERHSPAGYDHHDDTLKGEALYDVYVEMRQECPVKFSDLYGGFYTLTGYDDVRAVAQNHATFSSAHGILVPELDRPPFRALEFDPPVHGDHRKVMVPLLTPGEVSKAEGMIRRNAVELLDAVSGRGECEIIEDFSEPFAVGVIAEVLGITGVAKQRVRELTTDWVRNADTPAGDAAMGAYVAMMIAEVQDRRENPREDALTSMTQVKIRGELLPDPELAMYVVTMTLGGHHSLVSALASMAYILGSDSTRRDLLIEQPELIPNAVEETLRIYSPLHAIGRKTKCPAQLHGVELPADARVMMNFGAANRDPAVFESPDEFRVERPNANRHLAFGDGIHKCFGMHLARAEMRIATEEMLRCLPGLRLAEDVEFSGLQGGFLFSPTAVHVAFTPSN